MKAVIIEDNNSAIRVLVSHLQSYPEKIEIGGIAKNVQEGLLAIRQFNPDLLFLDIQLQDEVVFKLLEQLDRQKLEGMSIIFTTAYYTLENVHKALRYAAVEYVLKPIDPEKLFEAIDRAKVKIEKKKIEQRLSKIETSVEELTEQLLKQKVAIRRMNGKLDYVDSNLIYYIELKDKISTVYFKKNTEKHFFPTAESLKHFEKLFSRNKSFLRISEQVIINLNHLKTYKQDDKIILLDDETELIASRRKAEELLRLLVS